MKKIFISFIIAYFSYIFPILSQDYLKIKGIISSVSADSIMGNLEILTGEKSFNLNGTIVKITSRYRGTTGNKNAAQFLKNKLSNIKLLKTTEQALPDSGKNIISTQIGTLNPKNQIIICAHFDSMPSGENSPGADDNGTGTVAVLEAARILSQYSSANTIIYALFDQEEDNLNGSEYYASQARKNKDSILAVINLDMLGYEEGNPSEVEVDTRTISTSDDIAKKIKEINTNCGIGLYVTIVNPGALNADQASFWKYNYPGILLIHLANYGYYHKITDNFQKINKAYLTKCTKLGIASAAGYTDLTPMDGVSGADEVPDLFTSLEQNYPNPFNPITTINYRIAETGRVTLKIFDLLGREVISLVNEEKQAGNYFVQFNGKDLASGFYFYQFRFGNFIDTKKLLFLK